MSLIKSFNGKFLKQNLKKAKGTVLLCLIIVPLILSIYLVVAGIELKSPEILPQNAIGIINAIFMYVVPFVISVILFGFVFKKSSTDFMNSMPINRTTMFITNTLGGILLITIIQLASALIALLWGAIFPNVIVFPMLVLDTMIVSWLSYVFIFSATNLAMTISGTQKTQLIVTALILFLIPICIELTEDIRRTNANDVTSSYEEVGYYDLSITSGYQTNYFNTVDSVKNYTMPFKFFRYGVRYSWNTNLRMLALSIVYFFLGLKLYQKRKMEFSEESFSNLKLHIFVKGLTLIPVLLFVNCLNAYDKSLTSLVVAIILCGVYYVIFDIVSKRKVPIVTTIASFAGTIFIIQALIVFAGSIKYKQKNIDIEDIKAVSLGKNSNASMTYIYEDNRDTSILDGDYFIQNDQILDLILDGVQRFNEYRTDDEARFDDMLVKNIYFNIRLKSGKEYYIQTTILEKNYNEIISILTRDEKYMNHIKKKIGNANGVITVGNDIVDSKTKKNLEAILQDHLEVLSSNKDNDSVYYMTKYVYENHQVVKYHIPLTSNDELLKEVAKFANRQALENIKGYQMGVRAYIYDKSKNIDDIYGGHAILDFIEQHAADEFDPSQKYYIINGSLTTRNGYKTFIFYTNETKEIDSMVQTETDYPLY